MIDHGAPTSYFERIGEHRFRATALTSGAWNTAEQHIAPMAGLVVHAMDRHVAARGNDGLVLARLSIDILGVVGVDEFDLTVETVRPGRTIELLEAVATWRGRPVVRARGWRLAVADTTKVAGGEPDPLRHPDSFEPWSMGSVWPGGYITTLDVRPVVPTPGDPTGAGPQPGRAAVWVATKADLVAGEEASTVARFIGLVDTANGIAVRQSPQEWLFPNLDLTIYLYRQPEGGWVGLDTTVVFGSDGQGLTSTVLHDVQGPVGRAEQILTVRPAPAGS